MQVGRRAAAAVATVVAASGMAAALALAAAGPGTPQNTRVQSTFDAALVSSAQRTCTSADGEPVLESVEYFQAPSSATTSSDPRLDGRMDLHIHSIVYLGSDRRGLIDGNAHWFSGDDGPQTAYGKVQGMLTRDGIEAFFGGRNIDDGFAVRSGGLPKAKLFAPWQALRVLDAEGQIDAVNGSFGAPFLITATDGLLQAFTCSGDYEPVPMAPSTLAAGRTAGAAPEQRTSNGLTVSQLERAAAADHTEPRALPMAKPAFGLLEALTGARSAAGPLPPAVTSKRAR